MLLPLKSDLGDVSRILGCMVSKGDLAEAPRRFKLADSTLRRLDGKVEPAEKHCRARVCRTCQIL